MPGKFSHEGKSGKKIISKSQVELRELNKKFQPLEEYQDLVSQAIYDAIGQDVWKNRSFYSMQESAADKEQKERDEYQIQK